MHFRTFLCFSVVLSIVFAQDASNTTGTPGPLIVEYERANWTIATSTGDLKETQYYPAYYIDFAPCPCDLSPRRCDSFCCCDPLCDDQAKKAVFNSCIPVSTPSADPASGGVLSQFGDHMRLMLKRHYVTTPYLGHYYVTAPTTIRTATSYTDYTTKALDPDMVTFSGQDFSTWEALIASSVTNKIGSPVRDPNAYEAVPTPSLMDGRSCTFRSPVRLLEEFNTTCIQFVTNRSCINDPALNPTSYVHTAMALGLPPPPTTTQFPLFDNATEETMTEPPPPEWSNAGTRSVYSCKTIPLHVWNTQKPADCQLLSAQTPLASPTLQNGSRTCLGAVAAVLLRFQWSGRQIMNTSEIYLVNVPWGTELVQSFSVSWTHQVSDSVSNITTLPKTRTWPGYVWDDVIYGVSTVFNETRTPAEPPPSIARPVPILQAVGPAGDCPSSFNSRFTAFESLRFGPNVDSGCYMNLSKNLFRNCDSLRRDTWENWRSFYENINFLAKFDFNSLPRSQNEQIPFKVNEVVQLLHQSFDQPVDSTSPPPEPESAQPDTFEENNENLTRRFLDEYQRLQKRGRRQVGSSLTAQDQLQNQRVDRTLLPLACDQIPTEARLEIMYAEAGFINGTYLNAIIGALLRFRYATWRFSDRLKADQLFLIKNSVRFIKVPATEPEPIKKYYLTERRDHCPSAITCWDELFYPFLDWFPVEIYRYTQAVGLAMILGVAGAYMVSRPWW